MIILAIDTSTIAASVAVIDEHKLYGEFFTDFKLKHSEKLLPMIDSLLHELHMSIRDIDAYACTAGPGSFTGLRIGFSTIKGFAHPQKKPIYTVSTLEACAFMQKNFNGIVCPILDAQQSAVYTALFRSANGTMQRLMDDSAITLDDLSERLSEYQDQQILFCGDAVIKFQDRLAEEYVNRLIFADHTTMMPKASAVAALANMMFKDGILPQSHHELLPNYIRKSQAEVNYQVKLK